MVQNEQNLINDTLYSQIFYPNGEFKYKWLIAIKIKEFGMKYDEELYNDLLSDLFDKFNKNKYNEQRGTLTNFISIVTKCSILNKIKRGHIFNYNNMKKNINIDDLSEQDDFCTQINSLHDKCEYEELLIFVKNKLNKNELRLFILLEKGYLDCEIIEIIKTNKKELKNAKCKLKNKVKKLIYEWNN